MKTEASVDAAVSVAGLKFWHKLMDDRVLHSLANSSHTTRLSKEMLQVSQVLAEGGPDGYLLGMVRQASQQKGAGVASQLTQHWMQGPEDTEGLDLPAITIQVSAIIIKSHCGDGFKHFGLSSKEETMAWPVITYGVSTVACLAPVRSQISKTQYRKRLSRN